MIRIIFALFPAMVSVFLYGIAIYAKKSEKEFWQNAIRTTGVNLTKSYGDKQYNTKKLLRVVLPNGQTETITNRTEGVESYDGFYIQELAEEIVGF